MDDRFGATQEATDLAVIGGGITGCAVARDAAARGIATVLIEKRDLAAGTSGRSTKLLHGGLRYLERGQFRLVRQALREREITARLAPDLALPLRFVVPIWPGQSPAWWKARLGVAIYDALGGHRGITTSRSTSAEEIAMAAPALLRGYRHGIAFADRQTDDVRLTVALAKDARRRGASFLLGVKVVAVEPDSGGYRITCRRETGETFVLRAGAIVNATGAWADGVRRLAGRPGLLLRTSRGAHLVIDGLPLGEALLLSGERRGHRMFAIPWRGMTLFGTTDVEDDGKPGRDVPVIDDLRLLFHEVRRLFPGAGLTRRSVVSAFTGVRPLVRQSGDTLGASREHRVYDEDGLVTIVGGKLTTWRVMAIKAVDRVAARLGRKQASPAQLVEESLPREPAEPDLDAVLDDEMPRHADDVLFRRLPVGHDPRAVRRALPDVILRMATRLDWAADEIERERVRVIDALDAVDRQLDAALGPV